MAEKKKKDNKVLKYFKETKSELKKVVWPSFKQVKNNTLIVIACVLIIGAFIAVLDLGFTKVWTLVNPPAEEEVVEQPAAEEGTEAPQLTEEDMVELYKQAGINVDIEKELFTDIETGKELTDEEVTAKLDAYFKEAGLIETEEAPKAESEEAPKTEKE